MSNRVQNCKEMHSHIFKVIPNSPLLPIPSPALKADRTTVEPPCTPVKSVIVYLYSILETPDYRRYRLWLVGKAFEPSQVEPVLEHNLYMQKMNRCCLTAQLLICKL
jgi:hypothetical protein